VLRLVGGRTALRATHRAGNRRPQERRYEREERKGEGECCGGDDEEIRTNGIVLNEIEKFCRVEVRVFVPVGVIAQY
jgi:hypothetical protein